MNVTSPPPSKKKEEVLSMLRKIVADASGLEKNDVDPRLRMSDMGLDAEAWAQIRSAVTERFGVRLETDAASTLEAIAHRLCEGSSPPGNESQTVPLSSVQRRLYALNQREGRDLAYNVTHVLQIDGPLDIARLERGFQQVMARHDSLRTAFEVRGDEVVQRIAPAVEFRIQRHTLPPGGNLEELFRRVIEPFDVSVPPLMRVHVAQMGPERHVMIWDLHHLVFDGVSAEIVLRELGTLYSGGALATPPAQYGAYVADEVAYTKSARFAQDEAFWLQQFAESSPRLALPLDRPRPRMQALPGGHVHFELNERATDALKALCRSTGSSLFMVLLAAYSVLLHKLTGQEDLVLGVPSNGRASAKFSAVVGMFVNTLALRLRPRAAQTFLSFLEDVKGHIFRCFDHQAYPFEYLAEKAVFEKDMHRPPLFDAMFAFESGAERSLRLGDLMVTELSPRPEAVMCDLTLEATAFEREIRFVLHHCTATMEKETALRYAGYYQSILDALVAEPNAVLSDLEFLPANEVRTLTKTWGGTSGSLQDGRCFHELFEEQVSKSPERLAVSFGRERWDYGQLNARANQVAHALRKQGVGPDALVGLCVTRSPWMLAGLLGILKAGGAYVPIDPGYPRERIRFLLEDSGVSRLLTQSSLVSELPITSQRAMLLDTGFDETDPTACFAHQPTGNLPTKEIGVGERNLAYVIYTSGSTGKPKGVMLEHRGWVNLARAQAHLFGVTEASRGLQFSSMSFDAAAFEISMMLPKGASLCLITEEEHRTAEQLDEIVASNGVTHATLPPVLLGQLRPEKWRGVTTMVVAGEAITAQSARQWSKGRRLFNAYGPTETTVCATAGEVKEVGEGPVSIGTPLSNTVVRVLDKAGRLAPIGVAGELCVGGVQLARGYWKDEERTAKQFTEDRYAERRGERLYRTGDLARWLANGQLEFLGRIDEQVKIRGYRIELGEIEAVLAGHGNVKEAVVVTNEDQLGLKRLIAYAVPQPASAPSVADLRAWLESSLPAYMVPSAFVLLDRFPLTQSGKIDRRALPKPDDDAHARRPYEAPQGNVETLFARLWQELLHVDRVGREDDFFQLGGHSVLAAQVMVRARSALSIDVPVSALFTFPILKDLSAHVDDVRRTRVLDQLADMADSDVQALLEKLKTESS